MRVWGGRRGLGTPYHWGGRRGDCVRFARIPLVCASLLVARVETKSAGTVELQRLVLLHLIASRRPRQFQAFFIVHIYSTSHHVHNLRVPCL